MKSPFKFLDAYERQDKLIFFGREKETDKLYELVNKNKLVLLYGASGTGKTSLIKCGLGNRFDATNWFPFFIRRGHNINQSLRMGLGQVLGGVTEDSLVHTLEQIYGEYLRPIYLIFDQLEELFILGNETEKEKFIHNITHLIQSKFPCQIIFSLREEYLAELYHFEQVLPSLFDSRLRIEPMSTYNLAQVILKSCKAFNIAFEAPEENSHQIIEKLNIGRNGVSLPYLQVYLDRLYLEDYERTYGKEKPGQTYPELEFTGEEIEKLGDIGNVLKVFLQEQVTQIQQKLKQVEPNSSPRAVRKILNEFASLEGTKIPRQRQELSSKDIKEEGMDFVLSELQTSRLLRENEGTYELAHDTLSLQISEQRSAAEIALLEMVDLVQSRRKAFSSSGARLNSKELQLIANYQSQLEQEGKLSQEEWKFVEESDEFLLNHRRKQQMLRTGILLVLLGFLTISAWQWVLANSRLAEMQKAHAEIYRREIKNKQDALHALDYDLAHSITKNILNLEVDDEGAKEALIELAFYYNELADTNKLLGILQNLEGFESSYMSTKNTEFDQNSIKNYLKELGGDTLLDHLHTRYYPKMVDVEGGTFMMGDTKTSGRPNQSIHLDSVKDYQIGKYEITVFQYELYLRANGRHLDSIDGTPYWSWQGNNPMVYVDWYDALKYCNWLSSRSDLTSVYTITEKGENRKEWQVENNLAANGYRLPTEVEWEFAAGGGNRGRNSQGYRKHLFAGSDNIHEIAWYNINSDSLKKGVNRTLPVGWKKPNELQLYDLSGNVWEWCFNLYNSVHNNLTNRTFNPLVRIDQNLRVIRGGAWDFSQEHCVVYESQPRDLDAKEDNHGFRVARNSPK